MDITPSFSSWGFALEGQTTAQSLAWVRVHAPPNHARHWPAVETEKRPGALESFSGQFGRVASETFRTTVAPFQSL